MGYFVEVTYHVPESHHDQLDFPPVAKKRVTPDELSDYQKTTLTSVYGEGATTGQTAKLVPFLGEHREVMHHIALLKYYVEEMGVVITEVHRVWSFRQSSWMGECVKKMSSDRAASTDEVTKQVLKLGQNSLYGKLCQDKLKQKSYAPFTDREKFAKAASKAPDFEIFNLLADGGGFLGLVARTKRRGPVLDTPRAAAFTVLELSKLVVLKAHYKIRKHFGPEKCLMLFTDTDSLAYKIWCVNLVAELLKGVPGVVFDLQESVPDDDLLAEALRDQPAYEIALVRSELKKTKGSLGAFKLESKTRAIREFVGLACKMYSLSIVDQASGSRPRVKKSDPVVDPVTGRYDTMHSKGVPTRVLTAKSSHDEMKEVLFSAGKREVKFAKLQSFNHQICVVETTKRMLTCFQDKAYQVSVLESRPLGHWRNVSKEQRLVDARAAQEVEWANLLEDEDVVL